MTGMMGLLVAVRLSLRQIAGPPRPRGTRRAGSADCPPHVVLKNFGARPLTPGEAPGLYAQLLNICARAGMRRAPELFLLPVPAMNAYALGGPDNACITVTEGLLRGLSKAEVAGILAHEVAHILNHDTHALNWAAAVQSQIAASALQRHGGSAARPVRVTTRHAALLASAPALAHLLFLALSRVREFDADATALDLIDDPDALAAALWKLEHFHSGRTPLNAHLQDGASARVAAQSSRHMGAHREPRGGVTSERRRGAKKSHDVGDTAVGVQFAEIAAVDGDIAVRRLQLPGEVDLVAVLVDRAGGDDPAARIGLVEADDMMVRGCSARRPRRWGPRRRRLRSRICRAIARAWRRFSRSRPRNRR